jgi:uncharacterized protein
VLKLPLVLIALMLGGGIPAPRGYVNDFAGVIDAAHAAQIEQLARFVQAQSKGEIVVVTLADIGQKDVGDVALQIGRQWGVGSKAPVGDRARNAGVVVLVIPGAHGHVAISTGQGAEGFISDAVAGDIRREATPYFQRQDYGGALELIAARLAERYAREFGFSLDSAGVPPPPVPTQAARRGNQHDTFPYSFVALLVVFMVIRIAARAGRGRGGGGGLGSALPWIALSALSNRRGSSGGFGGFGGGGGGGGFGGFGGGGGFSGGGSSGSW